jgi:hypothetical protein
MFYDWLLFCKPLEHSRVGISSSLCVGKEGEKKVKPLGPLWGPLIKSFLLREVEEFEEALQ